MDHPISRPFSGPAALALALALAAPAARAEITPPAAKVVARYLDAVGGADVVRSVHSSHFRGSIEAFGLKGSTEAWSRAPDHQTARTEIGPFKLLNGYDGARAWRTDPTGKVSTLDGKDLEQAKADAYFENDQWLMPDQGGGKVAVVEEPEAGKDWTVLEVTPPVGRARRQRASAPPPRAAPAAWGRGVCGRCGARALGPRARRRRRGGGAGPSRAPPARACR